MTQEELAGILRDHQAWISGKGGRRANLSHADLSDAYLSRANLSDADLSGANLSRANLSKANLSRAYLSGAYLSGANLSDAYLSHANLSHANLSHANLSDDDLSHTSLSCANLSHANLSNANLSNADLSDADLSDANLSPFQICPEEGEFVAYKKISTGIAKLIIPADARRTSSLVGRKCRASKAISDLDGVSRWYPNFVYKAGVPVEPREPFNDDIRIECGSGIHFFMTRKEAEDY